LLCELLDTLLKQEKDFEKIFIVDNGTQNIQIDNAKVEVYETDANLGVAGSWNKGINYIFNDKDISYILALNDDINIDEYQLLDIRKFLTNHINVWWVIGTFGCSIWALSRQGALSMEYEEGKYFDENYFPAYYEDNDFYMRMKLIDETKVLTDIEELGPTICRGSMSIAKDRNLNLSWKNRLYYNLKWGGDPGKEKFIKPFNIS
jgi:hypothetical protein